MKLNGLEELIKYYETMLQDWQNLYEDYLENANDDNKGARKVLFGKIHGLGPILRDLKKLVNK